jgi:hypothetical protein
VVDGTEQLVGLQGLVVSEVCLLIVFFVGSQGWREMVEFISDL